jgi:YHS domain-containing protein
MNMIIKLLIVAFIFYVAYRVYRFLQIPAKTAEPKVLRKKEVKGVDLVEDPMCHTYIPLSNVYKKVVQEDGEPVYFCSQKCFEQYKSQTKQEDI